MVKTIDRQGGVSAFSTNDLRIEPDREFSDSVEDFAQSAVDHPVRDGRGAEVALRFPARADARTSDSVEITYASLAIRTNRFASALRRRDFGPGTGFAVLAGPIPEFYVAVLGALKAEFLIAPLHRFLGADVIAKRLSAGGIRILVATPIELRRGIFPVLDRLPELELIVVAGTPEMESAPLIAGVTGDFEYSRLVNPPLVVPFEVLLGEGSDWFDDEPKGPYSPALSTFTHGSESDLIMVSTGNRALGARHRFRPLEVGPASRDVFWSIVDPDSDVGASPGEVQAAFCEHPAVADCASIGTPDSSTGAYKRMAVVVVPGVGRTESLRRGLLGHGRLRLGPVYAPQEIEFVDELGRTGTVHDAKRPAGSLDGCIAGF
jgi:acyl-coenzyme A synthetase/AMP-(fatty) acid ligase